MSSPLQISKPRRRNRRERRVCLVLEHGIGNVARGVNGGEQAGLAAERLLGDQGGDGVAVGGGIVQDQ